MKQSIEKKRLQDLTYLRVTSLKTFEECPHTWQAQYLGGVKGEDSVASRVGTAVHSIMENFLLELFGAPESSLTEGQKARLEMDADGKKAVDEKLWKVVPEAEVDKLFEYMQCFMELKVEGYELLALEEECEQFMPGVPIPIRGHKDATFKRPSGGLLVVDHKTNRGHNVAEWWAAQLQQQLYSWMTREQRRPGDPYPNVAFRIGYPNLGTYVQWDTDAFDDVALQIRVRKIWADMERCEAEGLWPKKVNDKCRWCPLRGVCSEYELVTQDFARTVERRLSEATPGERYEFACVALKMVEGYKEEQKQLLVEAINSTPGGKVRHGNSIWWQEVDSKRAIDAQVAFTEIAAEVKEIPELGKTVTGMMNDLFTAKVGGIDKLRKLTGAFNRLDKFIVKKPNSVATLKTAPAGKLQVPDAAMKALTVGVDDKAPF